MPDLEPSFASGCIVETRYWLQIDGDGASVPRVDGERFSVVGPRAELEGEFGSSGYRAGERDSFLAISSWKRSKIYAETCTREGVEGHLPHVTSGLLKGEAMGAVQVAPSCGMRIQVPSPWLTLLIYRLVRTVWALDRLPKAARPSRDTEERILSRSESPNFL